jgi:hypothetical protein
VSLTIVIVAVACAALLRVGASTSYAAMVVQLAAGTLNTLRQTGSAITVGLCVAIAALAPLLRDRAR